MSPLRLPVYLAIVFYLSSYFSLHFCRCFCILSFNLSFTLSDLVPSIFSFSDLRFSTSCQLSPLIQSWFLFFRCQRTVDALLFFSSILKRWLISGTFSLHVSYLLEVDGFFLILHNLSLFLMTTRLLSLPTSAPLCALTLLIDRLYIDCNMVDLTVVVSGWRCPSVKVDFLMWEHC